MRVRIAFGGLPPQEDIAALLNRDEIPAPSLAQGNIRFALALLRGWKPEQLRSPDAHFVIFRNETDANTEPVRKSFPAKLVQFDASSGFALLSYIDGFDYALDTGFHLDRNPPPAADLMLLRTASLSTPAPVATPPPFAVDSGVYRPASQAANIAFPNLDPALTPDPRQLAITPPDRLAAFVDSSNPTAPVTIIPLAKFTIALDFPPITPEDITFGQTDFPSQFRMFLKLDPGANETLPAHVWLRKRLLATSEISPPAKTAGGYAPISDDLVELSRSFSGPGVLSWILSTPGPNETHHYLLQLSWPLSPSGDSPQISGKPFLLTIENSADGVHPTITGLDLASPVAAGQPHDSGPVPIKFPLESPASAVHMVAGGRGALLQFSGPPYWKLFWFQSNTWLPLPGPLDHTFATGNLSSLFTLDKQTGVICRFKLPTLELTGSATLPPADYRAILAGCNSDHSPIHVVTLDNTIALDSSTLHEDDLQQTPSDGHHGWPASGPYFDFAISGDGMALNQITNNLGAPQSYGVTGGVDLNNVASLNQDLRRDSSPDSRYFIQGITTLSENAPVIFHIEAPELA